MKTNRFFMVLCMLLTISAYVDVNAAQQGDMEYLVWVGPTLVTDANKDNIAPGVWFEMSGNLGILHLNNATISVSGRDEDAIGFQATQDCSSLLIQVEGECRIESGAGNAIGASCGLQQSVRVDIAGKGESLDDKLILDGHFHAIMISGTEDISSTLMLGTFDNAPVTIEAKSGNETFYSSYPKAEAYIYEINLIASAGTESQPYAIFKNLEIKFDEYGNGMPLRPTPADAHYDAESKKLVDGEGNEVLLSYALEAPLPIVIAGEWMYKADVADFRPEALKKGEISFAPADRKLVLNGVELNGGIAIKMANTELELRGKNVLTSPAEDYTTLISFNAPNARVTGTEGASLEMNADNRVSGFYVSEGLEIGSGLVIDIKNANYNAFNGSKVGQNDLVIGRSVMHLSSAKSVFYGFSTVQFADADMVVTPPNAVYNTTKKQMEDNGNLVTTYSRELPEEEQQGIDNVQRDDVPCTKVIKDGQLYLMYKETMYNVQGTKVE